MLDWQVATMKTKLRRLGEQAAFKVAWKSPAWLVYFATLRCIASATSGEFSSQDVPTLPAMEALGRWEQRRGGDKSWTAR